MGSGTLQPNSGLNLFTDADPIVPEEFNPVVEAVEANATAIKGVDMQKGTLPTSTNLDAVKAAGTYSISNSNSYTNLPLGVTYGVLVISRPAATAHHIVQDITGNVACMGYRRATFNDGATWSDWVEFNSTLTISSGNLAGVVFNANLADNSIYHLSVGRDPGFYLITTFGTVTITTIVDMGTGGGSSITTSGGLNLKIDFGVRGRPYKLKKVQ